MFEGIEDRKAYEDALAEVRAKYAARNLLEEGTVKTILDNALEYGFAKGCVHGFKFTLEVLGGSDFLSEKTKDLLREVEKK